MYAWIWRHLPFGVPGKVIGSLVLIGALGATLWYGVFPNVEQYLPFDNVQVGSPAGGAGGPVPGESLPPSDAIPYSTETNNPAPQSS